MVSLKWDEQILEIVFFFFPYILFSPVQFFWSWYSIRSGLWRRGRNLENTQRKLKPRRGGRCTNWKTPLKWMSLLICGRISKLIRVMRLHSPPPLITWNEKTQFNFVAFCIGYVERYYWFLEALHELNLFLYLYERKNLFKYFSQKFELANRWFWFFATLYVRVVYDDYFVLYV